jgi:hypothetical protein
MIEVSDIQYSEYHGQSKATKHELTKAGPEEDLGNHCVDVGTAELVVVKNAHRRVSAL